MRRSPFIQSSTSALLFKPVISLGSAPGYSATIFQSSSEFRTVLNVTFAFAMSCYARFSDKMAPLRVVAGRQIDPYRWVHPARMKKRKR
jgi:hypothetical protein